MLPGFMQCQPKRSGATTAAAGEEGQGAEGCQAERRRLGNGCDVAKLKQVELGGTAVAGGRIGVAGREVYGLGSGDIGGEGADDKLAVNAAGPLITECRRVGV